MSPTPFPSMVGHPSCVRYSTFPLQSQTMFSLALPPAGDHPQTIKQPAGISGLGPPPGSVTFCPAQSVPELSKGGVQLGQGGGLAHINGLAGFGPGVLNPAALSALAGGGGGGRGGTSHQTHEMTVPNEIIGCVIG